jgi:hypothetical protein
MTASPPEGRLVRSRVVADPGTALGSALDRELTGYAVLEPQDTLLLDADDRGVVLFRAGVPTAAYHAGTGRGGPPALADLAVPGPYDLELYAVDPDRLGTVPTDGREVDPGMPAERLAGDPDLAARTRTAAARRRGATPVGVRDDGGDRAPGASDDRTRASGRGRAGPETETGDDGDRPGDAVAAFLADERKIEAIRRQAREQARERAAEWGLDDQLKDPR